MSALLGLMLDVSCTRAYQIEVVFRKGQLIDLLHSKKLIELDGLLCILYTQHCVIELPSWMVRHGCVVSESWWRCCKLEFFVERHLSLQKTWKHVSRWFQRQRAADFLVVLYFMYLISSKNVRTMTLITMPLFFSLTDSMCPQISSLFWYNRLLRIQTSAYSELQLLAIGKARSRWYGKDSCIHSEECEKAGFSPDHNALLT